MAAAGRSTQGTSCVTSLGCWRVCLLVAHPQACRGIAHAYLDRHREDVLHHKERRGQGRRLEGCIGEVERVDDGGGRHGFERLLWTDVMSE